MVCLAVNPLLVKNLKTLEIFPERVANQVKKQVHLHKFVYTICMSKGKLKQKVD